jgi:hypothetical protein
MIFFPSDDRALIEFILSTFNYRKNINIKKTTPRKRKKRKLELSSFNSTNTAGFFYLTLDKL